MPPVTISDAYRSEQRQLHQNKNYGRASAAYAPLVASLLGHGRCRSLSDYGAGKRNLQRALGPDAGSIEYHPYDPAFPEYGDPQPADLVSCIDVLEHVEPELLDECLDPIASITRRLVLITVHSGPAKKTLSDGRNAHLIQQPLRWWLPKFGRRFDLVYFQDSRKGFFIIGCPRGAYARLDHQIGLHKLVDAARRVAPPRSTVARRVRARIRKSLERRTLDVGTLWLAARDKRTPWYVKAVAGTVSFLALSPIDLTPDFTPVIGYLDDLLLLTLGTFVAVRLTPAALLAELRERAATLDHRRATRGAAAVGLIWVGAALAAAFHMWRLPV